MSVRISIMMICALGVVITLNLWTGAPYALATDSLIGTVTYVRDGDTIEVNGTPVRLQGVNAPEIDKPLGHAARRYLEKRLLGRNIRCELNSKRTDNYNREIGICRIAGQDIGAMVIGAGLALDCPRYSNGRYLELEQRRAKQIIEVPGYC